MARQKKVVDASVLVKCFVHEKGSDAARELWDEHTAERSIIIVPDIAFSEILNALRYKQTDPAELQVMNKALWCAQFHREQTSQFLLGRALSLSVKHGLSVYDALYLAVAEMHGSPLYTDDAQLAKCPNTVRLGKQHV